MSTLSQRIPTFLKGISQQPDNKKFPGQLTEATNAFPDFVNGLVKRPGQEFFGELVNSGTTPANTFWFNIVRDETEKYVGQYDITAKQFKIWKHPYPRSLDGIFDQPELLEQKAVQHYSGSTAYTTSYESQANSYNTALQDVQTKLGILNEKQYDVKRIKDGQNTTIDVLFEVTETYGNQGDLVQALREGVVETTSGIYRVLENGAIVQATNTMPAGYAIGNERTEEYPLLTRNGERIYECEKTIAAANTSAQLTAAESALTTAQTNYNTAVSTLATAKSNLASAVSSNNNQVGSAYLSTVTSPDDLAVLNVIDKTFVINKKVTPALTSATSPTYKLESFITLDVLTPETNLVVNITWRDTGNVIRSFNYTEQVQLNGGTSDTELNALVNTINNGTASLPGTTSSGSGTAGHEITAQRIGNGIYLLRPSSGGNYGGQAYDIEVSGGRSLQCLSAFQQSVSTAADLPKQCKDGYLVKVANSDAVDADDYYVKFVCDSNVATTGPGSWEETLAPNLQYQFDPATMPHELIRKSNGHFELKPATWNERLAGDDDTNPVPSFVGEPIQSAFFYRNRLGFLAGQTVILSRSNDFFNFWSKTALTVNDTDPIDIDCSSTKPQTLRYVVPQQSGLVIFGQGEQFLLATDTDTLTPTTAKVNRLSNFTTVDNVEAVDTGIAIGFLGRSGSSTRHFELFEVSRETSAKAAETSLPVSDLIPDTIDIYRNEPNLSIVALATKNKDTAFIYRYLQQGSKRNLEGWFKWQFNDPLQFIYFDQGSAYTVNQDSDSRVYLSRVLLSQFAEGGVVRTTVRSRIDLPSANSVQTDLKLDYFYPGSVRSYNSVSDETTITAPFGTFDTIVMFENLTLDSSDLITDKTVQVQLESVTTTQNSDGNAQVTLPGDLRGKYVFVGNSYNLEVELPRPYLLARSGEGFDTDTNANLIVHRIKVNTGFTGPLKYRLKISGRTEFEENDTVVFPPIYAANTVPVSTEGTHMIPVQQRNDNFTLTLIGDSPYPVTLQSYDWEGRYTTNFYQRRPY